MKYRNKLNEFEAWQWKGYNHDDKEGLHKFFGGTYDNYGYNSGVLVFYSYNGNPIIMKIGDYIIKNDMGYYYPMSQDMFEELFEKIR